MPVIGRSARSSRIPDRCPELQPLQAPEKAELLGYSDVPRSGGDRDADPNRKGGEERREENLGEDVRTLEDRRRDCRMCEERNKGKEDSENCVRDSYRRSKDGQRFAQQELFTTNRSRQYRLKGALLALAGNRVGGEHGGREHREGEHIAEHACG